MDYSKIISETVASIKPSGIRKFFDLMGSMKDVVALTVGQPDFPTPWHIREAGIESLEKGMTYYTSNAGMEELRREIAAYMLRRFSLTYEPLTETMVTVGGSEAIDVAIRTVVSPGDEVIIPTPCFVCYEPIVRLAGGTPIILPTERKDEFKLNPEKLKALITPKTKMLVLPFPNNPTGAILTREELADIADVLRGTDIVVLSDEIYAELTYGTRHVSIAALPDMWERTILVGGFSKAYAMTGWRMGFLCAPPPLIKQALKIHQYAIMCAPTTSQVAATEALRNGDEDIAVMAEEYDRRRKYIHDGLKNIGIDAFEPKGAFYIFPDISEFGYSGDEFCEKLLYNYKCAIVPGSAFGDAGEGFARISYAYSVKHITTALERIDAFITDIKKGIAK